MDETVFFLAEDGLKGATAARAVSPFVLRPVGISAVEIAEMHNCSSFPSHLEYWSAGRRGLIYGIFLPCVQGLK